MVNPNEFVYAESRWQDIVKHLTTAGFNVYSPGVKVGECLAPYLVVKNDGSTRNINFSTDEDYYTIMCYVPKQAYSSLEVLVQRVKVSMRELIPMIAPAGSQTPSYYDDGVKAHMVSIRYKNYKKL